MSRRPGVAEQPGGGRWWPVLLSSAVGFVLGGFVVGALFVAQLGGDPAAVAGPLVRLSAWALLVVGPVVWAAVGLRVLLQGTL